MEDGMLIWVWLLVAPLVIAGVSLIGSGGTAHDRYADRSRRQDVA